MHQQPCWRVAFKAEKIGSKPLWDHWCFQEGRSEHKDENADAGSWSTAGTKMWRRVRKKVRQIQNLFVWFNSLNDYLQVVIQKQWNIMKYNSVAPKKLWVDLEKIWVDLGRIDLARVDLVRVDFERVDLDRLQCPYYPFIHCSVMHNNWVITVSLWTYHWLKIHKETVIDSATSWLFSSKQYCLVVINGSEGEEITGRRPRASGRRRGPLACK